MLLHRIKVRILSHRVKIVTLLMVIILVAITIKVTGVMDKSEEYAKIAELEQALQSKDEEVVVLAETIDRATEVMKIKDREITELETSINEHKSTVEELSTLLRYTKPTSRGLDISSGRRSSMQDIYINIDAVNKSSNLSKEEITIIAKYAGLESCVEELYTIDQNGVNVFFTLAVAMVESSYQSTEAGRSNVAKKYNNLFGATASAGGFIYYDSFNHSILKFGDFMTNKYFNKGLTSLSKINPVYCPPNPEWKSMVQRKIEDLFNHLRQTKGF